MEDISLTPGGKIARRPLHFIWIADCSGSMRTRGKIQALNQAISDIVPNLRTLSRQHPEVEVLLGAIKFCTGAYWHVEYGTLIDRFAWPPLAAGGQTDFGAAVDLLIDALTEEKIGLRAKPPILVLISDGFPTDAWKRKLSYFDGMPWGRKCVRAAIAIGQDADKQMLQRFIIDPNGKVLEANNVSALYESIHWVSTQLVKQVQESRASGPTVSLPANEDSVVW